MLCFKRTNLILLKSINSKVAVKKDSPQYISDYVLNEKDTQCLGHKICKAL